MLLSAFSGSALTLVLVRGTLCEVSGVHGALTGTTTRVVPELWEKRCPLCETWRRRDWLRARSNHIALNYPGSTTATKVVKEKRWTEALLVSGVTTSRGHLILLECDLLRTFEEPLDEIPRRRFCP